jgi:hypothetical protein
MKRPLLHVVKDFLICVLLFIIVIWAIMAVSSYYIRRVKSQNYYTPIAIQHRYRGTYDVHWYSLRQVKVNVFSAADSSRLNDIKVALCSYDGMGYHHKLWYAHTAGGRVKFAVKSGTDYCLEVSAGGFKPYVTPAFRLGFWTFRKTLDVYYPQISSKLASHSGDYPDNSNGNGPDTAAVSPASETTPYREPEYEGGTLLQVVYDSVRVRSAPRLESRTLAVLKQGETVFYLNEESETMSMVLRGKEQLVDKWLRIRTRTGIIGWVFRPFLTEYYYEGDDYGCP